jgi:hypothetical protein
LEQEAELPEQGAAIQHLPVLKALEEGGAQVVPMSEPVDLVEEETTFSAVRLAILRQHLHHKEIMEEMAH